MTAAARITQSDMERATKSVRAAGFNQARIIMRIDTREIEILIGDGANVDGIAVEKNPWHEGRITGPKRNDSSRFLPRYVSSFISDTASRATDFVGQDVQRATSLRN